MKSYFFILLIFLSTFSFAQDCKVELDNLKGGYTGDCINGKAEGQGKATGTDTYEGQFKKGYPDGYGRYVYNDNSWYSGFFKKGSRDGKGEMHYVDGKMDSVVNGYWKKDKYIGEYESPYQVINNTTRILKIDIRSQTKKGSTIIINMKALSQNYGIPTISNITIIKGNFLNKNAMAVTNGSMLMLQNVTFPFQARFYISNGETAELLFNEKGDWDVDINLQ